MTRVAVIGGTKFMGPLVVRELADQGHKVVYHRGQNEAALPQNVRHIHSPAAGIPITNFAPELLAATYDVVVHMIAMGEADARAAVQAFRGLAERLVVPGSGAFISRTPGSPAANPGRRSTACCTRIRRWTHGYVENVAAAITLAAKHPKAAGRVYNVGEPYTPAVAERLASLPGSSIPTDDACDFDFRQDMAYDTSRIREELGYP